MQRYILANTDFTMKDSPQSGPAKQLSFLSFLDPDENAKAIVFEAPPVEYLKQLDHLNLPVHDYALINTIPKGSCIDAWRVTKDLEVWAHLIGCYLKYPFHPLHVSLSSKATAFQLMPPSFPAALVNTQEELDAFLKDKTGLYVLKTPHQQSGQGHYFIQAPNSPLHSKFWPTDLKGCRIELWAKRLLDFSSQWKLDEGVHCLGLCQILNSEKGVYQGSIAPLPHGPYTALITEHLTRVKPILDGFYNQGLRGHLGIDAFIYLENETPKLCALIEINPRKTMGLVALNLAQFFKKTVEIKISSPQLKHNLLPTTSHENGMKKVYKKNLLLRVLEPHRQPLDLQASL